MSRPDRLTQPLYRKHGSWTQVGWDDAFVALGQGDYAMRSRSAARQSVGAIGGGRLTNEEAFALAARFPQRGRAKSRLARGTSASGDTRCARRFARGTRSRASDRDCGRVAERTRARAVAAHPKRRRATAQRSLRTNPLRSARAAVGMRQRVALIWDGIDPQVGTRVTPQAFADLARVCDLHRERTSQRARRRGDGHAAGHRAGYAPRRTRDATRPRCSKRARDGELAVLSIFGANPARNAARSGSRVPRRSTRRRSSSSASSFMTETAQRATLVLPAAGALREERYDRESRRRSACRSTRRCRRPTSCCSDFEMLAGWPQRSASRSRRRRSSSRSVIAAAATEPSDFTFGDARSCDARRIRSRRGAGGPANGRSSRAAERGRTIRATRRR